MFFVGFWGMTLFVFCFVLLFYQLASDPEKKAWQNGTAKKESLSSVVLFFEASSLLFLLMLFRIIAFSLVICCALLLEV